MEAPDHRGQPVAHWGQGLELSFQLEPFEGPVRKGQKLPGIQRGARGLEIAVWLENLDKIGGLPPKGGGGLRLVLLRAGAGAHGVGRPVPEGGGAEQGALREQDTALEAVREQVTALEATGRQLDGQVALFQGSIRNNEQNVARIREELSQQEGAELRHCPANCR